LGAASFLDALVTVTATGDTDNASPVSVPFDGHLNFPVLATVSVDGVGTATFLTTSFVFSNQDAIPTAAVGIASAAATILATIDPAFVAYDLSTAMAPIIGIRPFTPDTTFETTLGDFHLSSIGASSTFTATIASEVPLPAALPLFITGLGAMGLLGWRRSRRRIVA
jgi:hypothetical protein